LVAAFPCGNCLHRDTQVGRDGLQGDRLRLPPRAERVAEFRSRTVSVLILTFVSAHSPHSPIKQEARTPATPTAGPRSPSKEHEQEPRPSGRVPAVRSLLENSRFSVNESCDNAKSVVSGCLCRIRRSFLLVAKYPKRPGRPFTTSPMETQSPFSRFFAQLRIANVCEGRSADDAPELP
jgi:hypothetical protein